MNRFGIDKILSDFIKKVVMLNILALLSLSLLMVMANNILKERSARQAVSFIKNMVISNEMRKVIETLSMAEMQDFTGVVYFSDTGARIFSLPADLNSDLIAKKSPVFSLSHEYLDVPIYFGTDEAQQRLAFVRFIYQRFSLFP